MEVRLENGDTTSDEKIKDKKSNQFRIFQVPYNVSENPNTFFSPSERLGRWITCDSDDIYSLGAIPFFFANKLNSTLDKPIGIITAVWGGTFIQSWSSVEALSDNNFQQT